MKSNRTLIHALATGAFLFIAVEAHAFRILVSTTQLDAATAREAKRLACDGVWLNHFTKAPGFDDDALWSAAIQGIGTGHICSEDVYGNVTAKGPAIFNKSHSNEAALRCAGRVDNAMTYYESWASGTRTTVLTADERKKAAEKLKGGIVVLGRAYMGKWKTEIDEALEDPLVGGVIFEIKARAKMAADHRIAEGIKAVRAKGKRAYVLLAGEHPSINYTADSKGLYEQLVRDGAPMWDDDVFLVVAAYNVSKTKITFLGGDNSVEGAINFLKSKRGEAGAAPK